MMVFERILTIIHRNNEIKAKIIIVIVCPVAEEEVTRHTTIELFIETMTMNVAVQKVSKSKCLC